MGPMETPPLPPTSDQAVPQKKSKKKFIVIALIVLAVLAIPTCGTVGILVAIAIPALAAAKQEAQDAKAGEVFRIAEQAKEVFSSNNGRQAKTWADVSGYLQVDGQSLPSADEFMKAAFGGGSLEVLGIDGAKETLITLSDGRVVKPRISDNASFEALSKPQFPPARLEDLDEASRGRLSALGLNPSENASVLEAIVNLERVHVGLSVIQSIYQMVDWRALGDIESQPPEKVKELTTSFSQMADTTKNLVPFIQNAKKTSLKPEVLLLYENILRENFAMSKAALRFLAAYQDYGKILPNQYELIITHDKAYADARKALAAFSDSLDQSVGASR
jgi:hypothetical protein